MNKIVVTDELLTMWKRMPMLMSFNASQDHYIGMKKIFIGDEGSSLFVRAAMTRELVKMVEEKYQGDSKKALRACRNKLEKILDQRIDEKYKGKQIEVDLSVDSDESQV